MTVDCPLMSHPRDAQLLADYLLSIYKDPRDDLRNIKILANTTAAMMAAVRDLELIDKVVVTETQTGVAAWAGHIYSMTHNIKNRYCHELTFSLEEAPTLGTPFRLDTSALNSGHVLIY